LYPKLSSPQHPPFRERRVGGVTTLIHSDRSTIAGAPDRSSQVYRQLRELIVRGRLAPGSRIIESDVAERLQVSRTPVRAALQRLRQEGYVHAATTGRQLRLSIAPLTREDARELFGIVGEIEGLGARWAAALEPAARAELAGELSALNARLVAAASESPIDAGAVFDLHTRFHGHYMEGAAAPRLLALHRAIKPQAERYRRIYSSVFAHESNVSADEHEAIIGSIAAGEEDEAQRAVQVNWRNAAERLAEVIDVLGERGSW
jgi:DNA-binding GntR family transcriptional regulator